MKPKHAGWPPLENITEQCADDFLEGLERRENAQLLSVWRSDLYEVYEFRVSVPGWPGDEVTWLSIKRRDKDVIRDWRHLQRIKNDICGPEREALEMFPAESRLVDTSNQFHLYVLAEGVRFPFGYETRLVVAGTDEADRYVPNRARQRPFDAGETPADAIPLEAADAAARVALAQPGLTLSLSDLLEKVGHAHVPSQETFEAGSRVAKVVHDEGDRHKLGALATVVAARPLGYVVRWDGESEECFVAASKLRRA